MDGGWVVLRTQPQREMLAAEAVRVRGVETYVPFLPARRGSKRATPLFPGYLFARATPASDDLLRIRSAPGVSYVLPRAAPPLLVADAVVDALRIRAADHSGGARPLQRGDRVTIEAGPFRWLDAVFDRRLSAAGRVRIFLESVHRSLALDIDEGFLKRVKVA